MNWTREQKQAIKYDLAKPLLVSAAAGSGKTAVLIERIFQRIIEDKANPENILVMTFTEKAALQMRQKLDEKLVEELEKESDPDKLADLRDLKRRFPLAQISTIHAFCLKIVREYGAFLTDQDDELILEPGFNILSETHAEIYLEQAIDDVLNFVYEKASKEDRKNIIKEETSKIFLPQEIPETQAQPDFFNITNQPISQSAWLKDFDALSYILTESLTDKAVRDEIASFWKQLRSMPYFEKVAQDALREYQRQAEDFGKHPALKTTLQDLEALIDLAIEAINQCAFTEYYQQVEAGKIKTNESKQLLERLTNEKTIFQEIKKIFKKDLSAKEIWDLICEQGKLLGDPIILRAPNKNSKNAHVKLEFFDLYEANVLAVIAMLSKKFNPNSSASKRNHLEDVQASFTRKTDQIEKDMQKMLGPLARFFELVIMVDRRMQAIKRRYNRIDFNDFEHYALRLLDQADIAEAVHQNYKEVYLDEYQDTNPIQEIIVNRIRSPRIFMVGDLKQSIYRFRHADPSLFREKLKNFSLYEEENQSAEISTRQLKGSIVLLNKNFRSTETILAGINEIFSWFMHEDITEIEYDARQKLILGREDLSEIKTGKNLIEIDHVIIPEDIMTPNAQKIPELSEVEISTDTDLNLAIEALQTVYRIKKAIMEGRQYGEFAILGRTHRICQIYSQVLQAFDIPTSGGSGKTFLETTELSFLTQLINLLDNAKQDIPLASVMRSAIFDLTFTEDQLLLLRMSQPDLEYFHQVVSRVASLSEEEFELQIKDKVADTDFPNSLSDLHKKLIQFVSLLQELREKAKWFSLSEFLDYIFQVADYPDYLATLPFADQRLADIERFQEWANQFEQEQGGGVHNFITYLNKIAEQKLELENFHIPPAPSNSVAVMTIHASKGLEFPFVILAGSNNDLLSHRPQSLFSFDPDLGLSTYIADPDQQTVYSTPAHVWHQKRILDQEWAEEYRLMYVAMTRAEEKLIIASHTTEETKRNQYYAELVKTLKTKLSKENFQKTKTYVEIIIAYLTKQDPDFLDYFIAESIPVVKEKSIYLENYVFHCTTKNLIVEKLEILKEKIESIKTDSEKQKNQESKLADIVLSDQTSRLNIRRIEKVLAPLDQTDPLNQSPAKLTVSEINLAEQSTDHPEQIILVKGMEDMVYTLRDPILHTDQEKMQLSGMEFGTFIHQLMRYLSLSKFFEQARSTWPKIYQKQIKSMIEKKQILSKQKQLAAEAYQFIEKFLLSEIANRLYKAEKKGNPVYREIPFTLAIPAVGLSEEERASLTDPADQTLVQGMIDLWFIEDDQAIILDYKSDYILGDDQHVYNVLNTRYAVQLQYYALAIEKIIALKEPVKEKYIWLFRQGRSYLL